MATAFHDRVRETGTGTSGSITLLGAVAQYQPFSVVGNGNSCRYTVVDADGLKWGTFAGVWSTGGSLSRVTTLESSNGVGVAVTFSAGTHQVFLTPDAKALYDQATTQVLYNNAGLLAGHANFTFDPTMPGDILVRAGPPESTLDPLLQSYTDGQLLVTKLNGNGSGVGVEYETSTGNCNGFYFAGIAKQANSDNGAFEGDCYIGANSARFYNYGTYNEVLPGIAADAIYGFWQPFPVTLGAGSSLNLFVANWVGDMAGSATNIYYFWADSRGVYRIREDNVADGAGNPQAIPALYNPRFTKYTPGAADYERIIQQWVGNVATIGTEAGGTGTQRALNLIGSSVKVNGSAVGTVTSIATTSPITGGTITSTGTLALAVNVDFAWTVGQTITAAANAKVLSSTGYSLTGSNATNMLDFAGTWNTSGNPIMLKIAATNTASGATTKFASFLAGASGTTEVFSIDKAGTVTVGSTPGTTLNANGNITWGQSSGRLDGAEIKMWNGELISWSSTSGLGGTSDAGLARGGAGVVKATNGSSGYGAIDASAYKVSGTAGADFGPGLPTSITVVKGIITAIS